MITPRSSYFAIIISGGYKIDMRLPAMDFYFNFVQFSGKCGENDKFLLPPLGLPPPFLGKSGIRSLFCARFAVVSVSVNDFDKTFYWSMNVIFIHCYASLIFILAFPQNGLSLIFINAVDTIMYGTILCLIDRKCEFLMICMARQDFP